LVGNATANVLLRYRNVPLHCGFQEQSLRFQGLLPFLQKFIVHLVDDSIYFLLLLFIFDLVLSQHSFSIFRLDRAAPHNLWFLFTGFDCLEMLSELTSWFDDNWNSFAVERVRSTFLMRTSGILYTLKVIALFLCLHVDQTFGPPGLSLLLFQNFQFALMDDPQLFFLLRKGIFVTWKFLGLWVSRCVL
jgi:hypothetical protein